MSELSFNPDDFTHNAQREADKRLLVKFFMKPRQDKEASAREGRPIFRDVEYIDIKIPGKRDAGACRPVTDQERNRFPEHYRAFKDRVSEEINEGTPLSEWPTISRSMAEELAFVHVKTVEQLATMSDTQVAKFMGLGGIKQKAQLWLESVEKEKPLWEMDQKIRKMRAENEELRETVNNLIEKLSEDDSDKNPSQRKRARARAAREAQEKVG
jgi:predicted RNA-binding protein with RPS1 domain